MEFEGCAYEPDSGLAVDKAVNRLRANIIAGQRWPAGVSRNKKNQKRRKGADAKKQQKKTRKPRDNWIPRVDAEVVAANELHHALRRYSAEPEGTGARAYALCWSRCLPLLFFAACCAAQLPTPACSSIHARHQKKPPHPSAVLRAIAQARPPSWACLTKCSASLTTCPTGSGAFSRQNRPPWTSPAASRRHI